MYNAAQTNEKALVQSLLYDLCQGISDPAQQMGRPRLPLRDMVWSCVFKVYSTLSTRRFMTDLAEAAAKGYISSVPHFNSILNYFDTASLTPLLRDLIQTSSLPLKSVEVDFAVDSSGFSTSRYVRWYNARYGNEQDNHDWMKVHLMCGVKLFAFVLIMIAPLRTLLYDDISQCANALNLCFHHISGLEKFGGIARKSDTTGGACRDDIAWL
jgi:hypothetical protein